MSPTTLLLLPGLDGTGNLFMNFLEALPPTLHARVVHYPTNQFLSYEQLFPCVENAIPADGRFVLLAESFATPLAVRLAATNPVNLAGLVICAGFVTNPLDRWLGIVNVLARPSLFRRSAPDSILDYFLIGSHPPRDLRDTVHRTLRSVSPEVMALRARAVMNCDAREYLAKVQVPILYLQAAHDRLVKDRCFAEIKRLKPDTILASILGPHFLLQREPHQAAEAIVKFLQGL